MNEEKKVAIVGFGPKGLQFLIQTVVFLIEDKKGSKNKTKIIFDIFDEKSREQLGVGVHNLDKQDTSEHLKLNTFANHSNLDLGNDETSFVGYGYKLFGTEIPTLFEYINNQNHNSISANDDSIYIPRSKFAQYLKHCLKLFLEKESEINEEDIFINIHPETEVLDIKEEQNETLRILVRDSNNSEKWHYSINKAAIFPGHAKQSEPNVDRQEFSQNNNLKYIAASYNIAESLTKQNFSGQTILCEGEGLAGIDAILSIVRGDFEYHNGVATGYKKSKEDPESIILSSRTGDILNAKPRNNRTDLLEVKKAEFLTYDYINYLKFLPSEVKNEFGERKLDFFIEIFPLLTMDMLSAFLEIEDEQKNKTQECYKERLLKECRIYSNDKVEIRSFTRKVNRDKNQGIPDYYVNPSLCGGYKPIFFTDDFISKKEE